MTASVTVVYWQDSYALFTRMQLSRRVGESTPYNTATNAAAA